MSLPQAILNLSRRPEFWRQFFFEGGNDEFPELEGCGLAFPVGADYTLFLSFDPALSYFGLDLKYPGNAEPTQIAWDDQAHWHPHVLRWEELDLICRCVSLTEPTLPHPGLPLVLLHRFAPVCLGDRVDVIHPMILEAYRTVGAFTEDRITEMVHRYDRRQDEFVWRRSDSHGWYPDQDDAVGQRGPVYSLRHPENPEFPFAALNALFDAGRHQLDTVRRTSWLTGEARVIAQSIANTGDISGLPVLADALEESGCDNEVVVSALRTVDFPARGCCVLELLAGLPPGDLIGRVLGDARRPQRVVYEFAMAVPTTGRDGRMIADYRAIWKALNEALQRAELGSAGMYGASSVAGAPLGEYESIFVRASVNDNRERGLALIREVLTGANVSPEIVIRLTAPEVAQYRLDPAAEV